MTGVDDGADKPKPSLREQLGLRDEVSHDELVKKFRETLPQIQRDITGHGFYQLRGDRGEERKQVVMKQLPGGGDYLYDRNTHFIHGCGF